MRFLLLLSLFVGACACPPRLAPDEAGGSASATAVPEEMDATISVIGEGDGAVAFISVTADRPVWIDAERPARLRMGEHWVEVAPLEPPAARRTEDRVRTSASYRVRPELARFLARGGDVDVQLSVGGTWQTVTAERSDMLE